MISFLIKHKKIILIITLAFFLGSIVYLGADAYRRGNFSNTAAQVGSADITYRDLYRVTEDRARVLRNQGVDVDENMMKFLQQQFLAALISEEVLNQAAHRAGLEVSDYEIAYDIQTSPFFSQNGQFNKTAYEYALKRSVGMTPAGMCPSSSFTPIPTPPGSSAPSTPAIRTPPSPTTPPPPSWPGRASTGPASTRTFGSAPTANP